MAVIYCVEDDDNIRELVLYALRNTNYIAEGFEGGKEFFTKLEEKLPDLVILDIMLPEENGLSILKKLRDNTKTKALPIMMLTAKSSEYDKVKGLDLGADDYIVKPFGVMELISRVRALLRRSALSKITSNDIINLGKIFLDNERRLVTVDNEPISLTYKEFELLHYLLKNKNIVLTREKIMNEVWGFDFEGESRTVDVHIATLRQKLGQAGTAIKTIRNVGYKIGG